VVEQQGRSNSWHGGTIPPSLSIVQLFVGHNTRSVSGITNLQRRINNLQPSLCP
jgi:hypothetical protein